MQITISKTLINSLSTTLMSKVSHFVPAIVEVKKLVKEESSPINISNILCFANLPDRMEKAGILVNKSETEFTIDINDKLIQESFEVMYAGVEHLADAVVPLFKYFKENSKASRNFINKLSNISTYDMVEKDTFTFFKEDGSQAVLDNEFISNLLAYIEQKRDSFSLEDLQKHVSEGNCIPLYAVKAFFHKYVK